MNMPRSLVMARAKDSVFIELFLIDFALPLCRRIPRLKSTGNKITCKITMTDLHTRTLILRIF